MLTVFNQTRKAKLRELIDNRREEYENKKRKVRKSHKKEDIEKKRKIREKHTNNLETK